MKPGLRQILPLLIIGNVVCFFALEQASSYAAFYPGSTWRPMHLALSVELSEVALASFIGGGRLGFLPWLAGLILSLLFFCSVYFSGLHQVVQIEAIQSRQAEFDRQLESIQRSITATKADLLYFKKTHQPSNYARSARELSKLIEQEGEIHRPAGSTTGLTVKIWAIFGLRFAVKLAALILAVGIGAKPVKIMAGPPRSADGKFKKRIQEVEK